METYTMDKVSIQSLNALFDHFNHITESVLWIRSLDFQRQLYLSHNFENIWGAKTEHVYENPSRWNEFLLEEDKRYVRERFANRINDPEKIDQDILAYRMKDLQGNIHFMRGSGFLLTDQNNVHVAFGGITQEINDTQWHIERKKQDNTLNTNDPQMQLKKYLFEILKNELRINSVNSNAVINHNNSPHNLCVVINCGRPVTLTAREKECLYYLVSGKSAKQTAALLNVSPRTVEFHLENIKQKAGCRTKLELLGKTIVKA